MSIVCEKVERVVVTNDAPVVVCDNCGIRVEPQFRAPDWPEHPAGWIVLCQKDEAPPGAQIVDVKGVCSWQCVAGYAVKQYQQ